MPVEGNIIVHRIGVGDQAIVGDDLYAGFSSFFNCGGGSVAVLRADDEDFNALGKEGFHVLFFLGGRTLAEEELDLIAGFIQRVAETSFILHPARFVFGGQYDTHSQFAFSSRFFSGWWPEQLVDRRKAR